MTTSNVGGIFFTEKEQDFGKLFNEFNTYIVNLDSDMGYKEQIIFELDSLPETGSAIQALDSYTSESQDDLKSHFRSLNEAFDSMQERIETALNRTIT